ncbi:hypothetical protein [uncultured Clostridium sp.]|uniref:hypothetical protein n=1 Tax=uncultured Clostridium sp. TaxID=59620 RepID=UPI00263493D6|nr:hypothetical protein [uncultured Clostridium sp.]
MVEVKDFNEVIKYFENKILTKFNKEIKSFKDFEIRCISTNVDYLLSLDIDRDFKLKQLRTMYLNDDEISRVKKNLKDVDIVSTQYLFNQVGGKDISTHHKKGGCLTYINFDKVESYIIATINFRASVAPYNLYYDLIMINKLFKELGLRDDELEIRLHFDEIKGKLMQNFFYYISAGYYDNPNDFLNYDYGRMMVDQYNVSNLSNYKSIKRFYGKCNDAMERRIKLNG